MIYYISDSHFGDERVMRLAKRPFHSVNDMDDTMISLWNKKVGVAANGYLRGRAESLARKNGFKLLLPEKKLCTDNGAMVASQGYFLLAEKGVNCDLTLNAEPTLRLRGDRPSRR